MKRNISTPEVISIGFFIGLLVWWVMLSVLWSGENITQNLTWGAIYQLMAWWGGIFGLVTSRSWGGIKSKMGRTILYFSIGLLLQGFGQSAFSFYNIIRHEEIPYPSIADIGYFSSVLFYIFGIISLARITGASFQLKALSNKVQAFIIPIAMLVISYFFFLGNYEFNWSSPLRVFLDFGYPLGEAFYVSIAILALLLSRNMLGGIMRIPLIILMIALIAQYIAEFNFLTQALNSTWTNGGYGDVLYLISYFVMTISLIRISATMKRQSNV